jgi:putative hydrolase
MQIFADIHLHTLASQHAYSTITEYVAQAIKLNLEIIGISDHGPAMSDGPLEYYFMNLRILPDYIEGVRVLKGIELNIMDEEGAIDLRSHLLKSLDYSIASFHPGISPAYYSKEQYTKGYLNLMETKNITILGHIDNPAIPCDFQKVLEKAKETNTLIEINNSSYGYVRPGSYEVAKILLAKAKEIGNKIILNSDSHYHGQLGVVDKSLQLITEANYPEELIVNCNRELFGDMFCV